MVLQTEIDFTLPKGFLDADGVLHRDGVMRLATAADEILPLKDPRVQQNAAYLTIIVLSRVIVRLGSVADVNTKVIEGLFASDLNYLQTRYEKMNAADDQTVGLDADPMIGMNGEGRGFGVLGEA